MTDHNQLPQPPPVGMPYQGTERPPRIDVSEIKGWVRILENLGRYEVYWKGQSNVMVLIAHSLSFEHAEAMKSELIKVVRRFSGLPFQERTDVQHSTVKDSQQVKKHRQGGMGSGEEEGS
jgi:hypothetical protein